MLDKLNFKFNWKIALAGILVIILAVAGVAIYKEQTKVIPEELMTETLERTTGAKSYRYSVKLSMVSDGKEHLWTDIEGIKANETDFHIKGNMYETDVEIYQFEDITYQRDPVSDKWMEFPNTVTDMEVMMAEINPMSNFNFTQLSEIEYHGIEKVSGNKMYVLTCEPDINNELLELYWEDFTYRLWVDKGSKKISIAEIKAFNIQNPNNYLIFNINLWDFDKKVDLEKPK
ncbi:hypothetical protein GGQ84_002178 [Desulfitispora alkaliphila]|uniref:hypothetical protein n=1 Tax=Desulfitispora alkaliphila TaxID=622674 RepID=UPI003D1F608E